MDALLTDLAANFLWFAVGGLGVWAFRRLIRVLPIRRLWRLSDPTTLVICAATTTRHFTGEYHRPVTGMGQLRALSVIIASLSRAYRRVNLSDIVLSDEPVGTRVQHDLIILGGPKNNHLAKLFLDRLSRQIGVSQTVSDITWTVSGPESHFSAEIAEGSVSRDVGLIVRTRNPFSASNTTVCLFSGFHTYGVTAAAEYFTTNLGTLRTVARLRPSILAIVSCDVVNDYPTNIRLERFYSWTPNDGV